jgi:hypothetical protein
MPPDCDKTMYSEVCKDRFDDQNRRFDEHGVKLDEILTALKGNGKIGLCETIRNQAIRLDTIETEHKDVRQAMRGVVKWIFGIVGGSWLLAKSPELITWLKGIL